MPDQTQLHRNKITFKSLDAYEKVKRLVDFKNVSRLKILDVGCGEGILDKHLREMGHNVIGMDIFKNTGIEKGFFVESDINLKWPFTENSFDLAICTDVAEHLYDPRHILEESRRVLKNDGKLIWGVPNHFDFRQRFRMLFGKGIIHWDHLQYKENPWIYAHIRFWTLKDLSKEFAKLEFIVEKIQFNFMGGGIIPTRFTPEFLRSLLLKKWPGLFSGKFIFLLSPSGYKKNKTEKIYLAKTPIGL